jgi:hypothetical protein
MTDWLRLCQEGFRQDYHETHQRHEKDGEEKAEQAKSGFGEARAGCGYAGKARLPRNTLNTRKGTSDDAQS